MIIYLYKKGFARPLQMDIVLLGLIVNVNDCYIFCLQLRILMLQLLYSGTSRIKTTHDLDIG